MIFCTVGSQEPFDRLMDMLEVNRHCLSQYGPLVCQLGSSTGVSFAKNYKFLPEDAFIDYFSRSEFIISHAGMGNMILSLDLGKKIILVPRLKRLGEHRTDHQEHVASKFGNLPNVFIVNDSEELEAVLLSEEFNSFNTEFVRESKSSLAIHLNQTIMSLSKIQ